MYASLAIPPPAQSQPATAPAPPAGEAQGQAQGQTQGQVQGFGEALRRAVAAPANPPTSGAVAAEAPAADPAWPVGTPEPAELVDPAAMLPAALALAITELAPATAKAEDEKTALPEAPNSAPPKPDGMAVTPGLVMAPPPMPPAPPAMPAMTAEPALSALAMSGAPANTLQARAGAQRGIAAAALPPQAEHGPHAAEAAAQPAAASGPQPAPLLPLVPAFLTVTHELAQATAPHALAGRAEATASPDLQAAGLSAMHQVTGEAPREAPRAAPMPPARQVMPMAMAMLLSPGATPTLSVTLDPAELGRLEIRVGREAGGASLRLIAERPETLSLLVRDQRDLQQGLAQSGITLNADGIRFEMAEQDGHARQEQQRRPGGRSRPLAETNSANPQQLVQLSLLDIRI